MKIPTLLQHQNKIDALIETCAGMKVTEVKSYLAKYFGYEIKGNEKEVRRTWVASKSVDFMEQNGFTPGDKVWKKRGSDIFAYIKGKYGIGDKKK